MGSSVDISCTYWYPRDDSIKEMFWVHNQKSMHRHAGEKENSCTLRLEDIRESHSGEYTFSFTTGKGQNYSGLPGVNISVTDLQVWAHPDTVKERDKATLTCNTTCTLSNDTTFIWYKNGQPVTDKNSTRDNKLHLNLVSSEDAGSYSCAVRGYESLSSTTVSLTVRSMKVGIMLFVLVKGVTSLLAVGALIAVTVTCVRGTRRKRNDVQRRAQDSGVYETLQRRETPPTEMELKDLS
ncbi:sialoadhesin-like [Sardina pilchardus]|uniref:sialoadhesin-like n=1 Tax=Sardina pilchardus TaxID=27697 RepID=UPI002E0ECE27